MRRMDASGYAACFDHQQLALMCANSDRTIDRLGAENKQLKAENAKLRELADSSYTFAFKCYHNVFDHEAFFRLREKYRDSGIEVDG